MNNKIFTGARLVPMALAPLLALAGCGGAATSSPNSVSTPTQQATGTQSAAPVVAPGGETDVCKLVTVPEAATVLGVPVGAARAKSQTNAAGDYSSCTYPPATGNANGQYGVRVNMTRFHDAATAKTSFDMQRGADAVDIPDLGDAAFSAHGGGEIIFIKGSVLVGVGSSASDQGASGRFTAAAHTAARRA